MKAVVGSSVTGASSGAASGVERPSPGGSSETGGDSVGSAGAEGGSGASSIPLESLGSNKRSIYCLNRANGLLNSPSSSSSSSSSSSLESDS